MQSSCTPGNFRHELLRKEKNRGKFDQRVSVWERKPLVGDVGMGAGNAFSFLEGYERCRLHAMLVILSSPNRLCHAAGLASWLAIE